MNRNKVELMGRLTRDPETRTSASGLEIAEISLAINKRRKNAAGEIEEEATFIDVTLFDEKAKLAERCLRKGEGVMIDGVLRVDKWEDEETVGSNLHFEDFVACASLLPGCSSVLSPCKLAH